MIKTSIALVCLIASTLTFASKKDCIHTHRVFRCVEFVSNYDGDTITVSIPGQHELFGRLVSVRLNGIDTPEKRTRNVCEKALSIIAQRYLRYRILKSKSGTIELRDIQRGKYFRVVAEVWVNGRNVNQDMIARNMAVAYSGDTKPTIDWCQFKPQIPKDMDRFLERYELEHQ